eukprot:6202979-Pleurochrysis_carterae.AAC.1
MNGVEVSVEESEIGHRFYECSDAPSMRFFERRVGVYIQRTHGFTANTARTGLPVSRRSQHVDSLMAGIQRQRLSVYSYNITFRRSNIANSDELHLLAGKTYPHSDHKMQSFCQISHFPFEAGHLTSRRRYP